MVRLYSFLLILCILVPCAAQQAAPAAPAQNEPAQPTNGQSASPPSSTVEQRTQLNLVGQTDARSGESRRNENVQLTPLDTNIQRDLNQRLGTTATIVKE